MRSIGGKKTNSRYLSAALTAKIDTGVMSNRRTLRDNREGLPVLERLSDISKDDASCSAEVGDNYFRVSKKPEAFIMCIVPINFNSKACIREKARLNICIAKDLADSFGGRKADYLARLNRKLRRQIAMRATSYPQSLATAA